MLHFNVIYAEYISTSHEVCHDMSCKNMKKNSKTFMKQIKERFGMFNLCNIISDTFCTSAFVLIYNKNLNYQSR